MKKLLILLPVVFFVFAMTGCESDVQTPSSDYEAEYEESIIDLDSPTGGFSLSDEDPAFGEDDQFIYGGYETEYNDRIDPYRDRDRDRERDGAVRFRLRALWGRLACGYGDSTVSDCCEVDWSGRMTFHKGTVVIERLIAFEQGDYVQRIDNSTIEWVSRTCPHFDGIQVRLIAPPPGNDSLFVEQLDDSALTIQAGPFTRTFTVAELDTLNLMRPVDRCCNAIMINSHYIPPDCENGYLFGEWRSVEADTIFNDDTGEMRGILLGRFRGAWTGRNGRIFGHLKGIYGHTSFGDPVFYGKYIDFNGRFRGIVRGRYGPAPDIAGQPPHYGWFRGDWVGRNMVVKGRVDGKWAADTAGHGFFHGIWKMLCSDRSDLNPNSE